MKKILMLCLAFMLIFFVSCGDDDDDKETVSKITIKGVVYEKGTTNTLSDIKVRIWESENVETANLVTTADGSFSFTVNSGSYMISAEDNKTVPTYIGLAKIALSSANIKIELPTTTSGETNGYTSDISATIKK